MRNILTNSEVAHYFANNLQQSGQNSGGSFYFNNRKIYSYGSHFCIAKFDDGGKLLFTIRSYSNTTAKQVGKVFNATNQHEKIFCAYPDGSHSDNFGFWFQETEYILGMLEKAKKPEKYILELNRIEEKAQIYANYFNVSLPENLKNALAITQKSEILEYMTKKADAIKKQKETDEKERKQKAVKQLKEWRKFERGSLYFCDGFDYLRKDTEFFQTSQGVKIPFDIGMRFYNNLENLKVGDKFIGFEVLEITKQFLEIGCHKITFKEINSVVK